MRRPRPTPVVPTPRALAKILTVDVLLDDHHSLGVAKDVIDRHNPRVLELGRRARSATNCSNSPGKKSDLGSALSRRRDDPAPCLAPDRRRRMRRGPACSERYIGQSDGARFVACSAMNEINTRQARLQLVRDQRMGCQECGSVGSFPLLQVIQVAIDQRTSSPPSSVSSCPPAPASKRLPAAAETLAALQPGEMLPLATSRTPATSSATSHSKQPSPIQGMEVRHETDPGRLAEVRFEPQIGATRHKIGAASTANCVLRHNVPLRSAQTAASRAELVVSERVGLHPNHPRAQTTPRMSTPMYPPGGRNNRPSQRCDLGKGLNFYEQSWSSSSVCRRRSRLGHRRRPT